jgi:extracellular factor (EF) 3-hydroxypalmitic acid methyl ester biosynthesis protein
MEQVELGIRSAPGGDRARLERNILEELGQGVLPTIHELFQRFESIASAVDPQLQPMHRTYIKRQLHPLVLCSPFAYRTFQKPLGYAGDYEMVNMILRDPLEGGSLFAKTVNLYFLNSAPALAHRNRIKYLVETLTTEARQVASTGRKVRILNLGCGPAGEIQQMLATDAVVNSMEYTLLDFNDETLEFTQACLERLCAEHKRSTAIQFVKKSVHQLLKEGSRPAADRPRYEIVYCAGLFDYLSDRICQRLMNIFYDLLEPGGLLIATNVDPCNPTRCGMEFILDWHLIYRDPTQLLQLHPTLAPAGNVVTKSDDTGVNIYIEVRKPAAVA